MRGLDGYTNGANGPRRWGGEDELPIVKAKRLTHVCWEVLCQLKLYVPNVLSKSRSVDAVLLSAADNVKRRKRFLFECSCLKLG